MESDSEFPDIFEESELSALYRLYHSDYNSDHNNYKKTRDNGKNIY